MPDRNRVTPFGDVVAIPLRGAYTGNRGQLHRGREIVRFHAHDSWVTCALRSRAAGGEPLSAREMNRRLHAERLVRGTHRRRLHTAAASSLPDGAFVVIDGRPFVIAGPEAIEWATEGYRERRTRPRGQVTLLTPPSTVAVLQAGYPVEIAVPDTTR